MKFEHQKYQEECVNNIISILQDYDFENHSIKELGESLKKFYENSAIPKNLRSISENFKKLDIIMEAGTGKIFVYLKTLVVLGLRTQYPMLSQLLLIKDN